MKIYIDGEYYAKLDAKISVFDHGLLYGDGIFEGIRVYGGRIFKLHEHLRRLFASARALMIEIPLSFEAMSGAVSETVSLNQLSDGYVRLIVTRGAGTLGLDPDSCATASVIIIAGDIQLYPATMYDKGIAIITAATRRVSHESLEPRVKSLNYLNNVMGKMEAAQAGCMEAVMLNSEGYVAECTADNLFVVREGRLTTPPPYHGALDGITMRTVLDIAEAQGIETAFEPLTRYDLYTADECFMTGTGAEIMPVVSVDSRTVGSGQPGPVTLMLRRAFMEAVYA